MFFSSRNKTTQTTGPRKVGEGRRVGSGKGESGRPPSPPKLLSNGMIGWAIALGAEVLARQPPGAPPLSPASPPSPPPPAVRGQRWGTRRTRGGPARWGGFLESRRYPKQSLIRTCPTLTPMIKQNQGNTFCVRKCVREIARGACGRGNGWWGCWGMGEWGAPCAPSGESVTTAVCLAPGQYALTPRPDSGPAARPRGCLGPRRGLQCSGRGNDSVIRLSYTLRSETSSTTTTPLGHCVPTDRVGERGCVGTRHPLDAPMDRTTWFASPRAAGKVRFDPVRRTATWVRRDTEHLRGGGVRSPPTPSVGPAGGHCGRPRARSRRRRPGEGGVEERH